MKKAIILTAMVFLSGCTTSATTGYLPHVQHPDNAAHVTFVRNKNFWGGGLTTKVTLDGYVIAGLGPGHYYTFAVTPGRHAIGITESSTSLDLKSQHRYYFLISVAPGGQGFESERIPPAAAQNYIAHSTAIH